MAKAVTDMEKQDAYGVSMDDTNVTEERTYPTDHKFWELVDWDYEDKKSKEKERCHQRRYGSRYGVGRY